MLVHMADSELRSGRVVVLGSAGFIGRSLLSHLGACRVETLGLSSREIDLCQPSAGARLAELLREDDRVVVAAGIPPGKPERAELVERNARLAGTLHAALVERRPAHVVYVSSDAVYRDGLNPVSETSCADPTSLHGIMHRAREVMLQTAVGAERPLAILRPSLLYGPHDPHNGYGPNRFRRQAAAGETIRLFGNGEERRDHVFIDDVGEILHRVLAHRSRGILNIATGRSTSFHELAEKVRALAPNPPALEATPRQNPIVHRYFDVTSTLKAFPDFQYTRLETGLEKSWEAEQD